MLIYGQIKQVREEVKAWKREGKSVGFVPTMGYLHEGHKSLIDAARRENDKVVVSIFVNPMQFGPTEDLDSYPRDLNRDAKLCEDAGVDIIFHPEAEEMYADGFSIIREEDGLAKSSRNTYLSADERQAALVLSRSLKIGKQLVEAGEKSAKVVKDAITAEINKEPLAKIDYVDVVDFDTITPVDEIKGTTLVAIAVYIGKTRLIDNFIA